MSFPTIETSFKIEGPSPIRVAPFIGEPILPLIISYYSVQLKTNFPEVISTCPPPKLTAKIPLSTDLIISS